MKNTLNYLGVLLIGIIIGIVCSIVVRSKLTTPIRRVITDTTTVVKYDTIRTTEPYADVEIPLTIKVYPIAQVPTLLAIVDTMKIPYIVNGELIIPISQKYYRSPQYQAWISGYKPSLDSMTIFQPTTTITIENTAQKVARNELYLSADIKYIAPFPAMTTGITAGFNRDRWGVSLGGGIIAVPNGVKWYALVGLKYNLLTKKW